MDEKEQIKKVNFCCQKVLPLVFDDSLSYYEVLCKLTAKVNEVIGVVNEKVDGWIKEWLDEHYNDFMVDTSYNKGTETITFKKDDVVQGSVIGEVSNFNLFGNTVNVKDTQARSGVQANNELIIKNTSNITNLKDNVDSIETALSNLTTTVNNNKALANVKDYGAKGDGITDDTDAIRLALADTNYNGILLPSGTYLITSSIIVNRNYMHILGEGAIITTTYNNELHNNFTIFYNAGYYNVFEGLTFNDKISTTGSTAGCISCVASRYTDSTVTRYVFFRVTRCNFVITNRRAIGLDSTLNRSKLPYTVTSGVGGIMIDHCMYKQGRAFVIQSGVYHTYISNNIIHGTANDEFITIDNHTLYCNVVNNDIAGSCVGSGAIGVDNYVNGVIANNIIRVGNIAGISFNTNTGINSGIIIEGNCFIGNPSNTVPQIRMHYNTNNNFQCLVNSNIVNNTFLNSPSSIQLEHIAGTIHLRGNSYNATPIVADANIRNVDGDFNIIVDLIPYINTDYVELRSAQESYNKLTIRGKIAEMNLLLTTKVDIPLNTTILNPLPVAPQYQIPLYLYYPTLGTRDIFLNTNGNVVSQEISSGLPIRFNHTYILN